jgi:hypothetical protein
MSHISNLPRGFAQCKKAACGSCGFCASSLLSTLREDIMHNAGEVPGSFGKLIVRVDEDSYTQQTNTKRRTSNALYSGRKYSIKIFATE